MKLGVMAGLFAPRSLEEGLGQVAHHGFEALEFSTGNCSGMPCFELDRTVGDPAAVRTLRSAVEARGLRICALSYQGTRSIPGKRSVECATGS